MGGAGEKPRNVAGRLSGVSRTVDVAASGASGLGLAMAPDSPLSASPAFDLPGFPLSGPDVPSAADAGPAGETPPAAPTLWRPAMLWPVQEGSDPSGSDPSVACRHLPFVFWLVEVLRPRVLVDLGTPDATTYLGFCQAADRLGLQTRCHAVGGWAAAQPDRAADPSGMSTLHDAPCGAAAARFADGTVDVLHIGPDGFAAFDAWRPKLSDRGVVLVQGLAAAPGAAADAPPGLTGARAFLDSLRPEFPVFEFLHGGGLGLAGTGGQRPPVLSALLDADATTTTTLRDTFALLGEGCAAQRAVRQADLRQREAREAALRAGAFEVARLRDELAAATQAQDRLQAECDALRHAAAEARSAVIQRGLEAEQQATALKDATALAAALDAALDGALADGRTSTARLNADLAAAQAQVRALEESVRNNLRDLGGMARLLDESDAVHRAAADARSRELGELARMLDESEQAQRRAEAAAARAQTELGQMAADLVGGQNDLVREQARGAALLAELDLRDEAITDLVIRLSEAEQAAQAATAGAEAAEQAAQAGAARLQAERAQALTQAERALAQAAQARSETDRLAADLALRTAALARERSLTAALEDDLSSRIRETMDLSVRLLQAETDRHALTAAAAQTRTEAGALAAELDTGQRARTQAEAQVTLLRAAAADRSRELGDLARMLDESELSLRDAQGATARAQDEIGQLTRDLAAERAALARESGRAAALDTMLAARAQEAADQAARLAERLTEREQTHRALLSERDARILHLETDQQALLRSTSWKITGPLRQLIQSLRGR
jgi:chromosome segregation ATPase